MSRFFALPVLGALTFIGGGLFDLRWMTVAGYALGYGASLLIAFRWFGQWVHAMWLDGQDPKTFTRWGLEPDE